MWKVIVFVDKQHNKNKYFSTFLDNKLQKTFWGAFMWSKLGAFKKTQKNTKQ